MSTLIIIHFGSYLNHFDIFLKYFLFRFFIFQYSNPLLINIMRGICSFDCRRFCRYMPYFERSSFIFGSSLNALFSELLSSKTWNEHLPLPSNSWTIRLLTEYIVSSTWYIQVHVSLCGRIHGLIRFQSFRLVSTVPLLEPLKPIRIDAALFQIIDYPFIRKIRSHRRRLHLEHFSDFFYRSAAAF